MAGCHDEMTGHRERSANGSVSLQQPNRTALENSRPDNKIPARDKGFKSDVRTIGSGYLVYTDASYAQKADDRRSVSGTCSCSWEVNRVLE